MTGHPLQVEAGAAAFGLGPVTSVQSVARGAMGEVFRVDTDAGVYAVKQLFAWNDGASAAAEARFTAKARAAGVAVPLELPTPSGALVAEVDGVRYRAYEWFDVGPAFPAPVSPEVAGALGRLMGTLHRLSEPTDAAIHPWYLVPPQPERFHALAADAATHGLAWAGALRLSIPAFSALAAVTAGEPQPARLCHGDLELSNVLPLPDGRLAVLDWENLGPLPLDYEVATVLSSWCSRGRSVSTGSVIALLEGYAESSGRQARLTLKSFRAAASIWLNFLAVQGEAALQEDNGTGHVSFANTTVSAMLDAPLTVDRLDAIVQAATP